MRRRIEGCIIQTVSRALLEEVTFDGPESRALKHPEDKWFLFEVCRQIRVATWGILPLVELNSIGMLSYLPPTMLGAG